MARRFRPRDFVESIVRRSCTATTKAGDGWKHYDEAGTDGWVDVPKGTRGIILECDVKVKLGTEVRMDPEAIVWCPAIGLCVALNSAERRSWRRVENDG